MAMEFLQFFRLKLLQEKIERLKLQINLQNKHSQEL